MFLCLFVYLFICLFACLLVGRLLLVPLVQAAACPRKGKASKDAAAAAAAREAREASFILSERKKEEARKKRQEDWVVVKCSHSSHVKFQTNNWIWDDVGMNFVFEM